MILFGSTHGTGSDALFQLDTVFVVADYLEYSPSNLSKLPNHPGVTDDYLKAAFRMAFPKLDPEIPSDLTLRLYFGATASNRVDGMYSFAPARLAGQTAEGFPRVPFPLAGTPHRLILPRCYPTTVIRGFSPSWSD